MKVPAPHVLRGDGQRAKFCTFADPGQTLDNVVDVHAKRGPGLQCLACDHQERGVRRSLLGPHRLSEKVCVTRLPSHGTHRDRLQERQARPNYVQDGRHRWAVALH